MYKDKNKKLLAAQKYRLENREKIRASWKRYYLNNIDKIKAKSKSKKCKEQDHKSYLKHKSEIMKRHAKYRESHPWIYTYKLMKNRASKSNLPFSLTKKEFYEWFRNQQPKCFYCDLEDLNSKIILKIRKTKKFTIDRMDNDLDYTLNNICFACPLCNLLKSNFFSKQEWKEIAQKYIKPKWKDKIEG